MKNSKFLPAVAGSIISFVATAHAATVNGWGNSSDAVSGTTIADSGSGGNFTVSGTPTGNADWRAALPSTLSLNVGDSVTLSGSLSWATSGAMGGGGFRIGLLDFGAPGTLTGTTWNTTSADSGVTGYWWGLPTGGTGVSNPGGGEITRKPTGSANAWFSGTGGTSVSGTGNNNAGNMTPNTYNFSLTLSRTGSGVDLSYSMVGGSYSEIGSVSDTAGTVPLTFDTLGFFANTADNSFGAPGGVSFNNVDVTLTQVPEPSSLALAGIGVAGLLIYRRRN
jgi:hypothetical protein